MAKQPYFLRYFPSKKFIIILSAIIIVGLGCFLFFKYFKKSSLGNSFNSSPTTYTKSILDKDSDNDGLKDWEEALWKTDPNNPDTDGDGTPDGEEVKLERNPAVAGPDDKYTAEDFINNANISASSSPGSQTEAFSQAFLVKYLMLKQQNGTLDEAAKQELVNFMTSGIITSTSALVYKISDLKITNDSSSAALKNYSDKMNAIFNKYKNPAPGDEVLIFQSAMENEDAEKFAQLGASVEMYKKMQADFLAVLIPKLLAEYQLKFLNSLAAFEIEILKFENMETDPLSGLVAIGEYQKTVPDYNSSLDSINKILNQ